MPIKTQDTGFDNSVNPDTITITVQEYDDYREKERSRDTLIETFKNANSELHEQLASAGKMYEELLTRKVACDQQISALSNKLKAETDEKFFYKRNLDDMRDAYRNLELSHARLQGRLEQITLDKEPEFVQVRNSAKQLQPNFYGFVDNGGSSFKSFEDVHGNNQYYKEQF